MIVITLSACPPKLKGDLSNWCFEVVPGVYVGNPSKRVREKLWERVCSMIGEGHASLVYPVRSEQQFKVETVGTKNFPMDFDGITLMKHPYTKSVDDEKTEEEPEIAKRIDHISSQNNRILPQSDYVVLDLETNGLNPEKNDITEIAAVKIIDGAIESTFCRYVKGVFVPEEITEITGITETILQEKGEFLDDVLNDMIEFIGELPVVSHNADFDIGFLYEGLKKTKSDYRFSRVFDTLKASRILVKGVANYRLKTLLGYFCIDDEGAHDALKDAEHTYQLVRKLNGLL